LLLLLPPLSILLHSCYLLGYACNIIIITTIATAAVTKGDNNIKMSRISLNVFFP